MAKHQIELNSISIPMTGWVLWKGTKSKVDFLFRQLLRLESAETLKFNGLSISHLDVNLQIKMAAVFEWGGLLSNRTLEENLLLPFEYHGQATNTVKAKIWQVFTSLGYEKFLSDRPFYIPRNVQKLAAILRAFLQEPECILIHNLSFGLEERDKEFLKGFLQDYRHINVHFSEGNLYDTSEFTEVVDVRSWEKIA